MAGKRPAEKPASSLRNSRVCGQNSGHHAESVFSAPKHMADLAGSISFTDIEAGIALPL